MLVQYCKCVGMDNFLKVKKIVISNGSFRKTIFYCCEECYEKYFAETPVV